MAIMTQLRALILTALATSHIVSTSPVEIISKNSVATRDAAPAPQPYPDQVSHAVGIGQRDVPAGLGEPYYNPQTHSIEINTTQSDHKKRAGPGNGAPNPGRPAARIFYDTTGYVRVVMTTALNQLIQSFFDNVGNEVRTLGASIAHAVDMVGAWNADYNQNFQAQTVTLGINFGTNDVNQARGLADHIRSWLEQNQNNMAVTTDFLMGAEAALSRMVDPNAQPVDPPTPPPGSPRGRLMTRQAAVTDFCTAPAQKAWNLVVAMPDGAVTGGKATLIKC